jgi:transcriptional regulator with XRE-family HTH domain
MREVRSVNPNFGKMVKVLRGKRGLSLKQMKEMTGISESYINRLERGFRECPSFPIIEKLASALGVDPTELLEVGSGKSGNEVVSLEKLLFSCQFTVDGIKPYSPESVEQLLNLIDVIHNVNWNRESLIADIYEITQVVDDIKQFLSE